MKSVIIVGGGLAGLVSANLLARQGVRVLLIERKSYPFHRVCGEYISNETIPFLKRHDIFPGDFDLPSISRLQVTSVNGKSALLPLDLGGFGISRYTFDQFLYQKAVKQGAEFLLNTEVTQVQFNNERFYVKTMDTTLEADMVIGAYGKRSRLDVSLNRAFMRHRSPYAGVKYHIQTDHPADLISLHNFKDGYCGLSQVDGNKFTLCYLTHSRNLKQYGSIKEMETHVLHRNPYLKSVFQNSQFLYDRPEVINEITFATKQPVEQHLLMTGDAAGMITPLCGNGMAMAIHSAKLVSELIINFAEGAMNRSQLERRYQAQWNSEFARRLWAGRQIQRLFGNDWTSNLAVNLMRNVRPVADYLVTKTHGVPF